jgi:hypothetical protein
LTSGDSVSISRLPMVCVLGSLAVLAPGPESGDETLLAVTFSIRIGSSQALLHRGPRPEDGCSNRIHGDTNGDDERDHWGSAFTVVGTLACCLVCVLGGAKNRGLSRNRAGLKPSRELGPGDGLAPISGVGCGWRDGRKRRGVWLWYLSYVPANLLGLCGCFSGMLVYPQDVTAA